MKRVIMSFAVVVAAGFVCGCTSATSESLGSRLRFDKVPTQHEPEITTETDYSQDEGSTEPGDDF